MKAAAPLSLVALLATSSVALELNPSSHGGVSSIHARLHASRAQMRRDTAGQAYRRCKPKAKATSSPAAIPEPAQAPKNPDPAPAPTPEPASTPAPAPAPENSGSSGDVIKVKSSGCGDVGATADVTKTSGPNGSQEFLNCGVNDGGWRPPFIKIGDLKYKDLSGDWGIFKNCAQYSDAIYSASGETGLPPIMIASIMMQESSCNKDTVGGGGEQGLMQITHDKCGGAPNGDCKDPWYNIHTGAKYLANQINNNGGNALLAVGSYNGWTSGLTYGKATAARYSNCCRCQNNLDYLHQFFNGWLQGKDAYSNDLGVYKNLAVCGPY